MYSNNQPDNCLLEFTPLWRPEKVTWIFPLDDSRPLLERVPSKSARKFLAQLDTKLDEEGIEIQIGECTEAEYLRWLNLYREQTQIKHFDVLADPVWFSAKIEEGKRVEKVFAFSNGELVGGKIITIKNGIVRSAFKASRKITDWHKHNASLGLALDYIFLHHYIKQKPQRITTGTSRNLFGVINSIGYLSFKLRMGYQAAIVKADTKYVQYSEVPNNKPVVFFLTMEQKVGSVLRPYGVHINSDQDQLHEAKKYLDLSELPNYSNK